MFGHRILQGYNSLCFSVEVSYVVVGSTVDNHPFGHMAAPLSRRKEAWTLQMWNFREKIRQLSIIRATKYACFISVVIVVLNVSQNLAPRSHSTGTLLELSIVKRSFDMTDGGRLIH